MNISTPETLRTGQFISNAITEYLIDNNREISDADIGNALFYMSDGDLTAILVRYATIYNARNGGL